MVPLEMLERVPDGRGFDDPLTRHLLAHPQIALERVLGPAEQRQQTLRRSLRWDEPGRLVGVWLPSVGDDDRASFAHELWRRRWPHDPRSDGRLRVPSGTSKVFGDLRTVPADECGSDSRPGFRLDSQRRSEGFPFERFGVRTEHGREGERRLLPRPRRCLDCGLGESIDGRRALRLAMRQDRSGTANGPKLCVLGSRGLEPLGSGANRRREVDSGEGAEVREPAAQHAVDLFVPVVGALGSEG
jgi:hypothetical protein